MAQRAGAGAVQEGKSEAAHGRHFSGTAAYRVSHFHFLVVGFLGRARPAHGLCGEMLPGTRTTRQTGSFSVVAATTSESAIIFLFLRSWSARFFASIISSAMARETGMSQGPAAVFIPTWTLKFKKTELVQVNMQARTFGRERTV